MEYVYVLMYSASYDYETTTSCRAFLNREDAIKEMRREWEQELEDYKSNFDEQEVAYFFDGNYCVVHESDDFTRCHSEWSISKCEIE